MTKITDSGAERRLAALAAGIESAPQTHRDDFDWSRPAAVPLWLPRQRAARAISQFHLGELATAKACRKLRHRVAFAAARDVLDLQADDERRHADIYLTYLNKIGEPARRPTAIARNYETAIAWSGPPEGIILVFHTLLEGESLRLQKIIDNWMPCPLFRDISAAIGRDEGRHIAFGRIYLRAALPDMPSRQRLAIFRWVRELWFGAVRDAVADFAPPGCFVARGGYRRWLAQEWRERLDDFEALGLFTPEERQNFVAA